MQSIDSNDKTLKELYIYGCGGFGKEFFSQFFASSYVEEFKIAGFVDDNYNKRELFGVPVIKSNEFDFTKKSFFAVCIANPYQREKICDILNAKGIKMPCFIFGTVLGNSTISDGAIICMGSIVNIASFIGKNVIVCQNVVVGHETIIDDYSTLFPSCFIAGKVTIKSSCQICANSTIIQNTKITSDVIIGAGSVVLKDIDCSGTYVGVPIKRIK